MKKLLRIFQQTNNWYWKCVVVVRKFDLIGCVILQTMYSMELNLQL